MNVHRYRIPESPGNPFRLGRHVNHDPRSANFPAEAATTVPNSKRWTRRTAILDQGQLGSCTANAGVGLLGTVPLYVKGSAKTLREPLAVDIYKQETREDGFPGQYPPDDTGSDGLTCAKVLRERGYITSYTHAFGLDHMIAALALSPVMVGVEWLEHMFQPNSQGLVDVSGSVAGGHEFEVNGYDLTAGVAFCCNSWGPGWGLKGHFVIKLPDLGRLLNRDGDVTALVR